MNKMSFFNAILGNASTTDKNEVKKELAPLLLNDEEIDAAFKLIRDLIVFTNKRLILIDKQGITGKKVEYHSLPYKSISHFSVETAGRFDLDSELKVWVSGAEAPVINKQFRKDNSIFDIQKILAEVCMK